MRPLLSVSIFDVSISFVLPAFDFLMTLKPQYGHLVSETFDNLSFSNTLLHQTHSYNIRCSDIVRHPRCLKRWFSI